MTDHWKSNGIKKQNETIRTPYKQKFSTRQFHYEILPTHKEEFTPIFLKLFQKIEEEGTLPNSFYGSHHHSDTNTRRRCYRKVNYVAISLMDIDVKIFNKILANQIQKYTKGSYTMIKLDSFQGGKDGLIDANQSV